MGRNEVLALSAQLRTIRSRSKGWILRAAAELIERLAAENEALVHALHCGGVDCDLCAHSSLDHCTEKEPDCETCKTGCICSQCTEKHLNFKWNGKRYKSPFQSEVPKDAAADV